ncbi:MAG TPA: Clp protease N-terminal domain-containing protein, partial [Trichocoleus sp.]
ALVERVKHFFGFEFGFERFTESSINALNFARNRAVESQASCVEPLHLLAGLLVVPNTSSARLLRANGMKLDIETHEHSFEFRENPEFSSQSKFVLELALQVVRLRGGRSIEPEHLLWGLLQLSRIDQAIWGDLFQRYEIDAETLSDQLAEAI